MSGELAGRWAWGRVEGLYLALVKIVAVVILCWLAAYLVHHKSMPSDKPIGCDWFGYLRQAALFRSDGPAGISTELMPAVSRPLIAIARETGVPVRQWQEAIAPHCHHYDPGADHVILQYPPGTGFLLSLMPEASAARNLSVLSNLAIIALTVAGLYFASTLSAVILVNTVGCVAIVTLIQHWNSFSLGPAFVAAIVAGGLTTLAFERRSAKLLFLAGLVIGVSSVVRLPNVLLALGPAFVVAGSFLRRPSWPGWNRGVALALGLAIGLVPLLAANWINAGSPLLPTYAPADARPPDFSPAIVAHLFRAYLNPILAGSAMFALCLPFRRLRNVATLAVAISFGLGVLFFITHDILISYYPLPTIAFVYGGLLTNILVAAREAVPDRPTSHPLVAGLIGAAVVIFYVPRLPPPSTTAVDTAVSALFGPKTIVWSDMYAGFFVMRSDQYAAKIIFTSPAVQEKLVAGLRANGWTELFAVDSPRMQETMTRLQATHQFVPLGQAFGQTVYRIAT